MGRSDYYKGEKKKPKKAEKKLVDKPSVATVPPSEPEVVPKGKAAKPKEDF